MLHNIHDNFENLYKPIDENKEFYDAIQNNSHPFGSKNKCAALLFHLSKLSSCSISENKYHKPFPNEVNVNMAEYIFISKLIFAWIKSTEPGSDAEFKLKMNAKSLIKLIQYTSFTSFVNDIPSNENIISAGKINERLKCGMLYSDNDKYLFSPYIVKSLSWDMFTHKTKETIKNVKLLDILQYLYEHDIRLSKGYGAISTPLAAYHDGYMCNFEALIQGYRYILWKHFHKFGFEHNVCNVSDMQSFLNSVLDSRRITDYFHEIFCNAFTDSDISCKVFNDSGFMCAVYATFLNLSSLSAYILLHLFNRLPFAALRQNYKQTISITSTINYNDMHSTRTPTLLDLADDPEDDTTDDTTDNEYNDDASFDDSFDASFDDSNEDNDLPNATPAPIIYNWNLSCMLQYDYYVLPPWPFKLGHMNSSEYDFRYNFESLTEYSCIGAMTPGGEHIYVIFFAPNSFKLKNGDKKQVFRKGYYEMDYFRHNRITPMISYTLECVSSTQENDSYYEHARDYTTGYNSIFKGGALNILLTIITPLLIIIVIAAVVVAAYRVYQEVHITDSW